MSYTITLQPSGHTFNSKPDETLLDAALRQNITLPYGCRNGRCGSCIGQLIEGNVAYPSGKTEALENDDDCLVCQAVAESNVTIGVREVEQLAEIEVKTLPTRVHEIDHLAHDVIRIYLKLPENQRLQFLAGQYLEFILSDGRKRAFSIANAPHDDEFIELHIRHVDGGAFTDYAFEKMKEKSIQRIQAPLGSFTLNEDSDKPVIMMGGGTGFAPLKGIIEHMIYSGMERPIHLFWGVRSERDLYMPDLPKQWAEKYPHIQYTPVLSEPDEGWSGATGWVHDAVTEAYPDLAGKEVYMAGPPPMIIAARDAFRSAGIVENDMYYDSFEYGSDNDKK